MAGNLKLLAGLAAGYVLGARAGRERYERIAEATRRLAARPEVLQLTGKVRSGLGAGLEKAADTASDRLQQVRGEDSDSEGRSRADTVGPEAGEDHGRTRWQPPEAGRADESERDGGESSPGAGPSGRGRRERSPSGRSGKLRPGAGRTAAPPPRAPVQESFLGSPHGPPSTTIWAPSATGRRDDRAADRMRR